jgi:type IV secretory pathway VirB2 component (pilin)
MLIGDRRRGLMYLCLAGMEIAWITPFATLLLHQHGLGWSPGLTFVRLLSALLAWILMLDLLNLIRVRSRWYEHSVAGLLIVSTLLLVRIWLHPGLELTDLSWLGATFDALFNFHQGLQPELIVVLTGLLLWQRATTATSRSLDFFNVGVGFRLGILLLILGGGLLNHVTGHDATSLFWLYMALGLVAVALARIQDKSSGGGSVGKPAPPSRIGQVMAAATMTMGAAAGVSVLYTPSNIRTALGWLSPLWSLLKVLLQPLGVLLLWIIEIIINGLYWIFSTLLAGIDLEIIDELRERLTGLLELGQRSEARPIEVPASLAAAIRYGGVLLALVLMVGIILLSLRKLRDRQQAEETEEELVEDVTLGKGTLGRAWSWLRDRAALVRRFGVGRDLLAAISVQNMYANLCRLAGQRGYPRHPAQPPDRYLPLLVEAFDGHQEALSRITVAYMRVHYGDRPVSIGELAGLRGDYNEVRTSEHQAKT